MSAGAGAAAPTSPYASKAAATKEELRMHVESKCSALKEDAEKEIERLNAALKSKKREIGDLEGQLKKAKEDREKAIAMLNTAGSPASVADGGIARQKSGSSKAAIEGDAPAPREKGKGCVIS